MMFLSVIIWFSIAGSITGCSPYELHHRDRIHLGFRTSTAANSMICDRDFHSICSSWLHSWIPGAAKNIKNCGWEPLLARWWTYSENSTGRGSTDWHLKKNESRGSSLHFCYRSVNAQGQLVKHVHREKNLRRDGNRMVFWWSSPWFRQKWPGFLHPMGDVWQGPVAVS